MRTKCIQNIDFVEWNSNEWAKRFSKEGGTLYAPGATGGILKFAADNLGTKNLWGGYLEDRSFSLRDSYLEPSKFLHLGVDFFAPANTPIYAPCPMDLINVYNDTPEECGWGTRLLYQIDNGLYILFGHLSPRYSRYYYVPYGMQFAFLGDRSENGGWSPHLHIQMIAGDISDFLKNPASLDGYGEISQKKELAKRYPNPLEYI